MHELGEILREALRPIQAEAVAVSAQSDQHGCKIVLVHSALCRIANLLSGYGAHRISWFTRWECACGFTSTA
jgi:hypothetical protein